MRWEFERGTAHVGWRKGLCREMKREGFMEEGPFEVLRWCGVGQLGKTVK